MRILQILLISTTIFILSCEKIENDIPECIHDKIKSFSKSLIICDTGANVGEYIFQDELVYVFNPGSCGADMSADVYSETCENIGILGGIAGNTIINGVQFYQESTFQRNVWEND